MKSVSWLFFKKKTKQLFCALTYESSQLHIHIIIKTDFQIKILPAPIFLRFFTL